MFKGYPLLIVCAKGTPLLAFQIHWYLPIYLFTYLSIQELEGLLEVLEDDVNDIFSWSWRSDGVGSG